MVIRENGKLEFDISEGQVGKRSNSNVAVTRSSQDVCVWGGTLSHLNYHSPAILVTRTFLKEGNRKYLRIHLRPFGLLVWEDHKS